MRRFKKLIAVFAALTLVMMTAVATTSVSATDAVANTSIIFEDDGTKNTWAATATDDAMHGTVYKFNTTSSQDSAQLSSQALPAGKYMMSVDFKVEESTANEARQGVIMALNNWPENIVVNPRFNAENKFLISYGWTNGFASGNANKVDKYIGGSYSAYTINAWHNMAFVIETTDSTEEGVAQNAKVNLYIDGVAYGSAFEFKLNEVWKFQYLRMCAPKTANGATPMYIDNIVLKDVSAASPFAIEEVTPVSDASEAQIETLVVKLNQVVDKSTVGVLSVKKKGSDIELAEAATIVGQYLYIPVTDLGADAGYTLNLGTGVKSVAGTALSSPIYTVEGVEESPIIFEDDGTKNTWATTATDDAVHGTVYKFNTTSGQNSAQLSSQALPAGKYIMSVDFKVEESTANEARQGVIMAFNNWPENVVVNPKFNDENKFYISYGYTNGFASGTANKVDKYVQGNYSSYTVTQWHNMAFVIETTDSTEEGVAQNAKVNLYIDGAAYGNFEMKLKEAWKFQYLQMCAPKTANGATPMYIDNIVILQADNDEFTSNTDVLMGKSLVTTFNRPVAEPTLTAVTVTDAEGNEVLIGDWTFNGIKLTISVPDGNEGEKYIVTFNDGVKSCDGIALKTDVGQNPGPDNPNPDDPDAPGGEVQGNPDEAYGTLVYSDGDEQIFELDATVENASGRQGKFLSLSSDSDQYVGLNEAAKAAISGKDNLAISFDFKVGDMPYLNNIGVQGTDASVRIRRSGHLRENHNHSAEYVTGVGPTGGNLISALTWPDDGAWVNVCFVTTKAGVELYFDNELIATSKYYLGNIENINAHFRKQPDWYSYIDNFRIVDLDSCLMTANTNALYPKNMGNGAMELEVSFTVPVGSLSGVRVTDEKGNEVEIGEWSLSGAKLYIPLPDGDLNTAYNVELSGVSGVGGATFKNGSKKANTTATALSLEFNGEGLPEGIVIPETGGITAEISDGVLNVTSSEFTEQKIEIIPDFEVDARYAYEASFSFNKSSDTVLGAYIGDVKIMEVSEDGVVKINNEAVEGLVLPNDSFNTVNVSVPSRAEGNTVDMAFAFNDGEVIVKEISIDVPELTDISISLTQNEAATVLLDDISIKVLEFPVVKPAVVSCSFLSNSGKAISHQGILPAFLTKATIFIHGIYDEEDLKSNISIMADGKELGYSLSVTEDTQRGISMIECIFDDVLFPNTIHSVNISENLAVRQSDEFKINGKSFEFKTANATDLVILEGIEDGVAGNEIKLYKEAGSNASLVYASVAKSTVTLMVNGEERTVEKLEGIKINHIFMNAENYGTMTYQVDAPTGSTAPVECYLWSWPALHKININSEGHVVQ